MRIVLRHERPQWRIGTINDTPAMQIAADFYVTNTTHADLFILKTYFVRYTCNGWLPSSRPIEGHAFVKNHLVDGEGTERYKIPSGSTYVGHAAWWIDPAFMREGDTLAGRGCFVDQFDKEHWTPVITWTYQ